jgi:hypothetical protein
MTIRIDLTSNKATHLDNVVLKEGDVISFSDVSELDPPVPERVALLRLSPHGEHVEGIGMRIDEHTYVVNEM